MVESFSETPPWKRDNTDFPPPLRPTEARLSIACPHLARRNGAPHGRGAGGGSDPWFFGADAPREGARPDKPPDTLPPSFRGLPTICQEVETRFVWPSVTGIHPCRKPREPVREPRPPHRPQAAGCALERRLRQRQPGRGPGRSRCRHAAWHRRRSGADRPPNAGRAHDRGRGRVAPDTCCG